MLSKVRFTPLTLFVFCAVIGLGAALFPTEKAQAQSDPFGNVDLVYLDSVRVHPGGTVAVGIYLRNDEALGSLSIPLKFDTTMLTLTDISFAGSRVDYIATKIVDPANVATVAGAFTVAIIRLFEDPIPAGDGLLFTATFRLDSAAAPGQTTVLDTTFMPPGGEFLLAEATTAGQIHPAFRAGVVAVRGDNHAPVFMPLADQTVFEGDSLRLFVSVNDLDSDSLALAVLDKPLGAGFRDNGDGTGLLTWAPPYVGPTSSDGSPFTISFRATDGDTTVNAQTTIQVINRNRAPQVNTPDTVTVNAGDLLAFTVSAFDPDFEDVTWQANSSLPGFTFDGKNPGQFQW
ncbi:MAG: hypothetical protein D6800_02565, partial [Candidatus Zixiibacteriota bacterium]